MTTIFSTRYQPIFKKTCKNIREFHLLLLVPRNANLFGGKRQKLLFRMTCLDNLLRFFFQTNGLKFSHSFLIGYSAVVMRQKLIVFWETILTLETSRTKILSRCRSFSVSLENRTLMISKTTGCISSISASIDNFLLAKSYWIGKQCNYFPAWESWWANLVKFSFLSDSFCYSNSVSIKATTVRICSVKI